MRRRSVSPRSWKLRIEDILESIAKNADYTRNMDFEAFTWDDRTVDAVIRHFGIIGEAASRVPEEVRMRHPDLPWGAMRAMRNFVIHEYFGVSKEVVWQTSQGELPPFVPFLEDTLRDLDP